MYFRYMTFTLLLAVLIFSALFPFLPVGKKELNKNIKGVWWVHIGCFIVILIQLICYETAFLSFRGHYDLLFLTIFTGTGLALFVLGIRRKWRVLWKLLMGLVYIPLAFITIIILLLFELPETENIPLSKTICLRKTEGKIMTGGDQYKLIVKKAILFEKTIDIDFEHGIFYTEKILTDSIGEDVVSLTFITTEGDSLRTQIRLY